MNNILREKYLQLKIKTKKNYYRVSLKEDESCLDSIAKIISEDIDILEISGENVSDKFFLDLAKKIRILCAQFEKTFIIRSRADIATLCDADGICFTEKSIDIQQAKEILPENIIIGTHNFVCPNIDYTIYDFNNTYPNLTQFIASKTNHNTSEEGLYIRMQIAD